MLVQMIGADAATAMAYACELFCECIVKRAWFFTTREGRRTLQLKDLINGVQSSEKFDLLIDVVAEFVLPKVGASLELTESSRQTMQPVGASSTEYDNL